MIPYQFRRMVEQVISALGIDPPGIVQAYAGATAPNGWLMCDGTAVSRSTYSRLFTICGTTFGAGDSSTTFNLPDMRGIYPKGAGTTTRAAGVAADGTAYAGVLGTYAQDRMQGHKHGVLNPLLKYVSSGGTVVGTTGGIQVAQVQDSTTDPITVPTTDATNGTPRTNKTTEPQHLGLNYIIKT